MRGRAPSWCTTSRPRQYCSATSTTWSWAPSPRHARWRMRRPSSSRSRHASPANHFPSAYDEGAMLPEVQGYRVGLIETMLLLLLLLLAFAAITLMSRDRGLALGVTEPLLSRPPAAIALASI